MKTITQAHPFTFLEALEKLEKGECLGIRPKENTNYMVPYRSPEMKGFRRFVLTWYNKDPLHCDSSIRNDQYFGEWFLVVVDHRELEL